MSKTKKKKLVAHDLDGCMCDWDGAMKRDLTAMLLPGEASLPPILDPNVPEYRDRCEIIKGRPGWWLNLVPLASGFKLYELVKEIGFKSQVLTKGPRRFPMAWAEKVQWCAAHMPGVGVNIVMNKELFNADVLIDDFPPYNMKWLDRHPNGLVIMPDRPWNQWWNHQRAFRYRDGVEEPADFQLVKAVLEAKFNE